MTEKHRIGIYGGTFNPPHVAHIRACEAFYREIKPDTLLVIPAFLPPHKEISDSVTTEDRLEMTRLAFDGLACAVVSDMEIKRGGRSYTATTLAELKRDDNELYFLCGTDMFLTLDSWYCPDKIFSLATICYVRRESEPENDKRLTELASYYKEKYNARIIPILTDVTELSSTELREKIKNCDDISKLIPEKVNNYIQMRGLYR